MTRYPPAYKDMADKLFFCVIKEYGQTGNMAGKVWHIKILSGSLSVGDRISLFCVDLPGQKCAFNKVEAVAKHIKRELDPDAALYETALQGDIVTVNLKQCYLDGKKIDKKQITAKNVSAGCGGDVCCDGADVITVKFDVKSCGKFIDRLLKSYDGHIENPKQDTAYNVSFLWLGKRVNAGLLVLPGGRALIEKGTVKFKILYGQKLPVPRDDGLRGHIRRAVFADQFCAAAEGRNRRGAPGWNYYVGELLFNS